MKAAIFNGPHRIDVGERPDPAIQAPTDAIVRVVMGCVCGSDLWYYRGDNPLAEPFRIGHEFVGIAVDFGIQFGVRYRDQHYQEPDHAKAMTRTARRAAPTITPTSAARCSARPSARALAKLLAQVAHALAYAHARGVVGVYAFTASDPNHVVPDGARVAFCYGYGAGGGSGASATGTSGNASGNAADRERPLGRGAEGPRTMSGLVAGPLDRRGVRWTPPRRRCGR